MLRDKQPKRKVFGFPQWMFQPIALWRRWLFSDVSPVIAQGRRRPLEIADIPALPATHDPRKSFEMFVGLEPLRPKADGKIPWFATVKFLGDIAWRVRKTIFAMFVCSVIVVCFDLLGPILIHRLLSLVSHPEYSSRFFVQGSLAAIALGVVGALSGVVGQHYIYKMLNVGMIINAGLNHAIYETSLRLSRLGRQKSPTGDVVNLMGSDTDAVQDAAFALNEFLMVLFTIAGAALLMVHYLGNAGLSAVVALCLIVPPTKWIAKKFCLHSDAVAKQRDKRVAYMTQVMTAIRIVKSFAWEPLVLKKTAEIRQTELKHRRKFIHAAGISVVLYRSIGTITGGAIFATMVYLGEPLTAAKLFTAMALIAVMEGPFGHLTDLLSMLASAQVSAERIGKFLATPETPHVREDLSAPQRPVGLVFDKASFQFEEQAADAAVLRELQLRVEPGQAIAIVGPVGSGKSAFLAALLGELKLAAGTLSFIDSEDQVVVPRIAYVPQEAFIQNTTLRNNILFGSASDALDDPIVEQAIKVACLESDLAKLPGGLQTEIGEHGVNLSGGQKQRVALARAVVKKPTLALLDDPLSALDHKTEDQVLERLIFGEWQRTTRVVVTHRLKHLSRFDRVLFLESGRIVAQGSFESLMGESPRFVEFYSEYLVSAAKEDSSSSASAVSADTAAPLVTDAPPQVEAKPKIDTRSIIGAEDAALLRITENEDRQYGAVHRPHYGMYLKAMWSSGAQDTRKASTFLIVGTFIAAMVATTLMPIVLSAWMGAWGDALTRHQEALGTYATSPWSLTHLFAKWVSSNDATNIWLYVGLAALSAFIAWLQYVLYGTGGVRAGENLHDAMLKSVLGAKIRFFDATPIGRILNRFSKDLDTVERNLPWSFEQTIRCSFHVVGALALITAVLPWTLVMTVPVMILYYRLQRDYRISSREAQRLYSVTRSPRFSHFKETLMGLPVIRAFDREEYFRAQFLRNAELNIQMFHGMVLLNRWFSVRVALTASLISITVGLAAVWSAGNGLILAGTAGLVLTYGMKFWETLNWAVRSFSQLEAQMTSVERVARFAEIPQEEILTRPSIASTHERGQSIVFDGVEMRYAAHLPMILKGLSFAIPAGARVGIIGKTGAGKSSLFHALFRFSEISAGDIQIGNRSIRDMTLVELRRLISIVPQDPTLFMGTFRSNCDPFDQFSDSEIWHALSRVQIADRVRELVGGLNGVVTENGFNLSQGERQLICLARALLSNAPIILMDEATSGIDVETDARIQETIRREFVGRTILMIAHRLATVADCDSILELRDGVVVQANHPGVAVRSQKTPLSQEGALPLH